MSAHIPPHVPPPTEEIPPNPNAWKSGLDCTKEGEIKRTIGNVLHVLAIHPEWAGVLTYDDSRQCVVTLKAPPVRLGDATEDPQPGPWTAEDNVRTAAWFGSSVGFEPTVQQVSQSVATVARKNRTTGGAAGQPEGPRKLSSLLDSAYLTAERRRSGEEKPVPVPWPEYASILGGGFWSGVHTVIGGTGVGKSQEEFQCATYAAQQGVPAYYVGLELSEFQVAMRASAEMAGMGWSRFYTGQASERDMQRLAEVRPALESLPLYIERGQAHGWAPSRMISACENIRKEHPQGPMLVVLDFLQLVAGEVDERGRTPDLRERIARAAYAAVHIADRYGAAVKLVSSAARDKYGLLASDAKGCGLGILKGATGPTKVLGSPEALIGLGKESGEIEYSVESQTVLIKWPTRLDNGDKLIIAAVPKLRYGAPSWTALAFGRRFTEYSVGDMSELPEVTKGGAEPVGKEDYSGRVLETIRKRPGLTSGNQVKEVTKGNAQQIGNALKDLLRDGRVVKTPNGYEVVPEPVPETPQGTA